MGHSPGAIPNSKSDALGLLTMMPKPCSDLQECGSSLMVRNVLMLMLKSASRARSHRTSLTACAAAMCSVFAEDPSQVGCRLLSQVMTAPIEMKTNRMDRYSSRQHSL